MINNCNIRNNEKRTWKMAYGYRQIYDHGLVAVLRIRRHGQPPWIIVFVIFSAAATLLTGLLLVRTEKEE